MTDPGIIIPAAAGLAGAIIGGVLSIIGSVIVSRHEHRWERRGRVYDDYLPGILYGSPASANMEGMLRAAKVASRKDRRRAERIRPLYEAVKKAQEGTRLDDWGNLMLSEPERVQAEDARQRLRAELVSYADWLAKKLR